jgi:flagellar hook assembly protein FlgD
MNSQYTLINSESNKIDIQPKLFSPDGDGYKDLLSISINETQSNQSALIQIYNSKGILVKDIAYNSNLGFSNTFLWDGFDNGGIKSPIGNYIVYLEIYDRKGITKKHKEVVSIGGRI